MVWSFAQNVPWASRRSGRLPVPELGGVWDLLNDRSTVWPGNWASIPYFGFMIKIKWIHAWNPNDPLFWLLVNGELSIFWVTSVWFPNVSKRVFWVWFPTPKSLDRFGLNMILLPTQALEGKLTMHAQCQIPLPRLVSIYTYIDL